MISFFSENITYKLKDKRKIQKWIKLVIEGEKKKQKVAKGVKKCVINKKNMF